MKKNAKKIVSTILVTSSIINANTLGVFANEIDKNNEFKVENQNSKVLQENDIVSIPDENLKRELNYTLGQNYSSDITVKQLRTIKELHLNYKDIKNLEGIQYCTNATYLELSSNQISDVSKLNTLGNLTYLNLASNNIEDISVLNELINLTDLALGGNQISDISALRGLISLENLNLSYNQISDISPLRDLTNLINLDLGGNEITDISSIDKLINLKYIILNENNLNDITAINKLVNLTNLSMCENKIDDISPVSELINLESLGLHTNQISDISPLSNLTKLHSVTLFTNQISDISPLKDLNVKFVNARHQKIVLPTIIKKVDQDLSFKNEVVGRDGLSIVPENISDGGIYNRSTKYINWRSENISNLQSVSYQFTYNDLGDQIFAGKVTQPIEVISEFIIKNPISNMYVGSDYKLIASADGKDIDNVTWSVDNSDIATISSDGVVNAKKSGNVRVTVNINNTDISYTTNINLVNFDEDTKIPSVIKDNIDINVFSPVYSDATGDENSPIIFSLNNDATISDVDIFVNNMSKLSSSVLSSKIEGNYTIYKIKIPSSSKAANYSYIEVKVDNNMPNASDINTKINKLKEYRPQTSELVGRDRYDTAIKVSQAGWENSEVAVLVNSGSLADALSVTPFASQENAPVLLSNVESLNSKTRQELERLGTKKVYLIGGTASLSENVANELESMGISIERISGRDRYYTSLEIAKRLNNVEKIAVVNGIKGFADAVSIAPVCARDNMAIVYSSPQNGLDVFADYIKENNITNSYIIGGTGSLPDSMVEGLKNPERISGKNRNITNLNIIKKFYSNTNYNNQTELNNIFVAKNGMNNEVQLIDALSVGVLAAKESSPVMLVDKNGLDSIQSQELNHIFTKKLTKVGGSGNELAFEELKNQVNHIK